MGYPELKSGIIINNQDAFDLNPEVVKNLIANDESGILKHQFSSQLADIEDEITKGDNNYDKHHGRPPLSEIPFMESENDGVISLPGHAPGCDGEPYHQNLCKCKFMKQNASAPHWERHAWANGPLLDDLD